MCCYKNLKTEQLRYQEDDDGMNISERNKIFTLPSPGAVHTTQHRTKHFH